MALPAEIKTFLWAVISHWQGYVTGGVVTAVIGLVERSRERNLSKRAYLMIFVGAYSLLAFFMAWRDQFERAESLQAQINQKAIQAIVPRAPVIIPPTTGSPVPPCLDPIKRLDLKKRLNQLVDDFRSWNNQNTNERNSVGSSDEFRKLSDEARGSWMKRYEADRAARFKAKFEQKMLRALAQARECGKYTQELEKIIRNDPTGRDGHGDYAVGMIPSSLIDIANAL